MGLTASSLGIGGTRQRFKIPNASVIYHWVKTYERLGARGLLNKARGRKKSIMTKKSGKKKLTPTDPVAQKVAEMQKE
jgi:hypothetical protein